MTTTQIGPVAVQADDRILQSSTPERRETAVVHAGRLCDRLLETLRVGATDRVSEGLRVHMLPSLELTAKILRGESPLQDSGTDLSGLLARLLLDRLIVEGA